MKNEVYGGAVTLDLVIQAFFFLYLIMGGVSKKNLTYHLIYLSLHPLTAKEGVVMVVVVICGFGLCL